VIEHIASKKTPTPISAYQVTGLALELCKLPPDSDFDAAMEKAFRILVDYNAKLDAIQKLDEHHD
jgi:hypothetical protein